jgi:hypothetical protein
MRVSFQMGDYYLCAEAGGGRELTCDRETEGPWELFHVEQYDDGTVSLQADDGHYVCAELDGTVVANRDTVGPWERWTFTPHGDTGVTLRSAHGKYLCAEGGGGPIVVANRPLPDQDPATVPGEWEVFTPSEDWWLPDILPNTNRLTGDLWRDQRVIGDATGPRILMFCHFMEAFSAWCHGREAEVEAQCAVIAERYAGVRVLDVLGYWDSAWKGREVSPIPFQNHSGQQVEATPDYWERKRAFVTMLHDLGLKIFDDRGDMNSWDDQQKRDHMGANGEFYDSLPFGREVLAGVWAINEAWQNGGDNCELLQDMIDAFAEGAGWRPALCGLSSPGGSSDPEALADCTPPMTSWEPEMPDSFKHWSQAPATVITCHGNRGDPTHIIEHYFGYGYDEEIRNTGLPVINTEPVGGGDGVSVGQVNDPELLCGLTAAALLGGQAWTFMSGHGVFWNGPIESMCGFAEVARLPEYLPQDIATFQTVCHSGERFKGTRILAVVDPTRADQAIHEDGRFVMVVHTQEQVGHALSCERACDEFTVINMLTGETERTGPLAVGQTYQHPGVARLVVGQLAAAELHAHVRRHRDTTDVS